MPLPADFAHCINDENALELPLSYVDPFMALHFHFGMLLGVIDFEAQQAYHRGKSRLHNAWLHGAGVVWGLRVTVDRASNEIRVEPGLALDRAGHELYLDAKACVDIGAWYDRHEKDPDVMAVVDDRTAADVRAFKGYVVARFRACLTREVPALAEPCEGGSTETAFSRVAETIELDLRAGDPPAPPLPDYERARIFLGLHEPRVVDGVTLPGHKAAADERARVAALPADERPAATAAALHRFIALDAMDRVPAVDVSGENLLFPAPDDEGIVLGAIDRLELRKQGNAWTLMNSPTVHFERRDTLVPTSEIQYLLRPLVGAAGAPAAAAGPIIASFAIKDNSTIELAADKSLDAPVVQAGTGFSVTSKVPGGRWVNHRIRATLAADTKTVSLKLTPDLPPAGAMVRVIAHGTGPQAILGADLTPLGATSATAQDGRDFVGMKKRS
jgi:hypothetical protein